ncbi:MAG: cobalamin biosynthesis protein CobD [Desulfobacula sp.]|nr:cobalamin biosynthesis protein CobD [Desulfobacula sp.]
MFEIQWYIILSAFILDFILGDPAILPHPIIYMGRAIDFFEKWFRKKITHLLISGFLFACFLIISTWLISFIMIRVSMNIHPFFGSAIEVILLFFCFSSTSLEKAALKVFYALKADNADAARKKLSMIVGRETQNLDENAMTRATVETVAENFVDGFLSPLFFVIVGGVPLALAYKMINTLDSMVGYQNDKYTLFGRASARIDDIVNFIPARISVLIIALSTALLSMEKSILSFKIGFSQGFYHKSPNAGYPEAAFSGALKIRLGGPSFYHGSLVEKPYIGKEFQDPEQMKIKQACDLMLLASFIAVLISCFAAAFIFPAG